MNPPDERLSGYLQRVAQLRQNADHPQQKADLEAIAPTVGLSPFEVQQLQQYAEDCIAIAQDHLEDQRWGEAIAVLKTAQIISPLSADVLYGLAWAYYGRDEEDPNEQDHKTAIRLAQNGVTQYPDHSNFAELLQDIRISKKESLNAQLYWGYWLGGGIVAMIGCAFLGYFIPLRLLNVPETTPPAIPQEEVFSAPIINTGDKEIPVSFHQTEFKLEIPRSQLNIYQNEAFYRMQGVLINQSSQEVERIEAKFSFIDQDNQVIETQRKYLQMMNDAVLRPGDRHGFDVIQKVPTSLKQVNLNIVQLEKKSAARSYRPSEPIELIWAFDRPDTVDLAAKERQEWISRYGEKITHRAVWEITNTGERDLRLVQLQIQFYDQAGELLETSDRFFISSGDPPLKPGETRLLQGSLTQLSSNYKGYQLEILEAY